MGWNGSSQKDRGGGITRTFTEGSARWWTQYLLFCSHFRKPTGQAINACSAALHRLATVHCGDPLPFLLPPPPHSPQISSSAPSRNTLCRNGFWMDLHFSVFPQQPPIDLSILVIEDVTASPFQKPLPCHSSRNPTPGFHYQRPLSNTAFIVQQGISFFRLLT